MDQRLSRPQRWRMAVNRATSAVKDLQDLRSQWASRLEELREELNDLRGQAASKCEELDDALADLRYLQSDYDCWTVPENLSDSRLQEKLFKVQEPNFKGVRNDIPELKKFFLEDELEWAPEDASKAVYDDPLLDNALGALGDASELDLPKGYGRD